MPDPSGNPRPYRTIWLLNQMNYEVWSLSPRPNNEIPWLEGCLPIHEKILAKYNRVTRKIFMFYWRLLGISALTFNLSERLFWFAIGGEKYLKKIKEGCFAIIIVEDLQLLNRILLHKHQKTKVLFDGREYAPREFEQSLRFRFLDKPRTIISLNKAIKKLNAFYTVCDSLSSEYQKDFAIKPDVVWSTPFYQSIDTNVDPCQPFKMVHHGNANTDRGLQFMIEASKLVGPKCTLDLYLVGNQNHINELKSLAQDSPWIRFQTPVPFSELNAILRAYDIGLYLLQPTGFNTRYALPNKFFEFIQARLAVVIGPSPEMESIVHKYSCGLVSKDFSCTALAEVIQSITPKQLKQMKLASDNASKELCWEIESNKLRNLIENAT